MQCSCLRKEKKNPVAFDPKSQTQPKRQFLGVICPNVVVAPPAMPTAQFAMQVKLKRK
jgi:hypothetical protein